MMNYKEENVWAMIDDFLLFFGTPENLHQDLDAAIDILMEYTNTCGAGEVDIAFRILQMFHFCRAIALLRYSHDKPPAHKPKGHPYYYALPTDVVMKN